jgi:hypothetical protein
VPMPIQFVALGSAELSNVALNNVLQFHGKNPSRQMLTEAPLTLTMVIDHGITNE